MDFEQYWQLIGGDVNFSDRKQAAEKAWNLCVAEKHGITTKRVIKILKWFYEEAKKRKKYDFLIKFSLSQEH